MIDNRENNIWTVYIHIIPKTITKYNYDKYYVGITSQSVIERWNNGNGYHNQIFYKAIKKYGWDNIEHYIIAEHLTEDEAKKFEKILINKLKSNTYKCKYGYNRTNGGDGTTGFIMSNESKNKISKSHIGEKNPFYGKIHSKESRLKMSESHKGIFKDGKKVYQFDLNGNYINTYNSAKDAIRSLSKLLHRSNMCSSNIGRHIKSHTPYCNFLWGFESDITIINNIPQLNYKYNKKETHFNSKCIYQFDLNGNFIKSYTSCKLASKETNIYYSSISKTAKNLQKTAGGYIWRYKNKIGFDKNNKPILLNEKYENLV